MNNAQKAILKVNVPFWMSWLYGSMSLSLIPWIIFLQATLPEQRISLPWRAMWVVFDLALFTMGAVVMYFLIKKSLWASMALTILATLFTADAWFDIMTSPTATERSMAIVTDLFIEIPLAILSLCCAVYILRQVMVVKHTEAQ